VIDGVSPGMVVLWEAVQTNGSTLNFTIAEPMPGTNSWNPSSPQMLNESTEIFPLANQGVAVAIAPNGNVVAVWQKRQTSVTDDADLYYKSLSLASTSIFKPNLLSNEQLVAPEGKDEWCDSLSFDLGKFNVPDWLPAVGGNTSSVLGVVFVARRAAALLSL